MRAGHATLDQIREATGLYRSINCYQDFFTNKIYKGVLEFGDMVIDDYCDPIVPTELWDRVNEMRAQNRPGNGVLDPRRVSSVYLLSGLCHCQDCGSPLVGHRIKRWKYYICARRKRTHECGARHIPKEKFEHSVLNAIRERALATEQLISWQENMAAELDRTDTDIERARLGLRRDLVAANKQIANLTRAIAQHGHSDSLLTALRSAETQSRDIDLRIDELENLPQIQRREIPEFKDIAAHIEHIITAGADDDKRLLARSIITRIVACREATAIRALVDYLPVQILNHPTDNRQSDLGLAPVPPRGIFGVEQIELIIPIKKYAVGVK
jgi:hypothetical protein